MRPLRELERDGRCSIEIVRADGNTGDDRPRRVGGARSTRRRPCLAVATHASNVTGVLLPVGELAAIAAEAGVPLVVDASQSAGHIPLDVPALGASAVAMPGHKGLLGPSGTGLLYLAPGVERRAADPRRHRQPVRARGAARLRARPLRERHAERDRDRRPRRRRGVPGRGRRRRASSARLTELGRRFRDGARRQSTASRSTARPIPADSVGIVSLNVEGIPCATVARLLDDEWGVMTRAGLHCSPAAHRSLGTAPDGTVRFSWGFDTTDEEIDIARRGAAHDRRPRAASAEPAGSVA